MYLEKTLSSDEKILQVAKLHWICYLLPWLLIFLGLFTLVVGYGIIFLLLGLYYYLRNTTTEMIITNNRVIAKCGIVSIHTTEIRNIKIEGIRLHQSVLGRILGYGNIIFTGTGNAVTVFEDVIDPVATKSLCEEIIENNRH